MKNKKERYNQTFDTFVVKHNKYDEIVFEVLDYENNKDIYNMNEDFDKIIIERSV